MAIVGGWEFEEKHRKQSKNHQQSVIDKIKTPESKIRENIQRFCSEFIDRYCSLITNGYVASVVMILLAGYMYISIYGLLNFKAELKPEQLFLQSSDVIKVCCLFVCFKRSKLI